MSCHQLPKVRKLNRHKRAFLEERKSTEELSRAHNKFDESPFLTSACLNTAWSSKEPHFLNCVFDNLVNGLLIIINIHIYRFVWIWARRSSCHLAQILIDIKMFYFRIVSGKINQLCRLYVVWFSSLIILL